MSRGQCLQTNHFNDFQYQFPSFKIKFFGTWFLQPDKLIAWLDATNLKSFVITKTRQDKGVYQQFQQYLKKNQQPSNNSNNNNMTEVACLMFICPWLVLVLIIMYAMTVL